MRNFNKRAILNWRNGLFFVLGLLVATGLHLAFSRKKSSPAPAQKEVKLQHPWGDLEYTAFKLTPPDEAVGEGVQDPETARALARTPTLLMLLRVTPHSDLDALLNYWGKGNRGKAMRPFLQSLARVPEGEAINVSYFMPALARMRLYTFPDLRNERRSRQQDCFWTAMNFFSEVPDDSLITTERVEAKLMTDYGEIKANHGFGDVVVLRTSERQIRHVCVHLADGVVFTKPAAGRHSPWVLMRLADVVSEFHSAEPLEMAVYRKKQI